MEIQRTTRVHSRQTSAHRQTRSRPRLAPIAVLPLALAIGQAQANPDGGVVVGGQAAISQTPGVTTVDQASDRAIINWRGFNIDRGELTRFNQPGKDAVALNRVLGKDPSKLLGQLKANGHVWLVNPNGILFGPSARIDVHGLLATTADIADQDFLAGRNNFSIPSPNADASVVNRGTISIGQHGLGGLVAPHVRNAGVIQGELGQVVIGGAPTFTLDFYGDGLIQFEATSKVTENADPAAALVHNDGRISVDGGDVLITANAAAGVVDEAINMEGIIEARSVSMEDGAIVLNGGDEGIVRVAGRLDASGRDPGETGGTVKVLGEKVALYAGTGIDVSGDAGGGAVLVGGNFQGRGPEPNAARTYVAAETTLHADAVSHGDGGKVIVWADEVTGFEGHISASGGSDRGDGGLVEVSGKQALSFEGTVDITTTKGQPGTLLLDPENIVIVFTEGSGAPNDNELDDNQILFDDSPGATFTISEAALEGLPANANVILEAANDITIESLGDDTLNFQSTTGSVTLTADADLNGLGTFTSQNVDIETQGGNVAIEAATVAGSSMEIRTNGGDISFKSRAGGIPFNLFLFTDSSSDSAAGGSITVEAQGDVFLSGRQLNVDSSGILGGGAVTITSNGGTVDMGNLNTSSSAASGGEVTVSALGDIFTGSINSSGSSGGGDVSLASTTGSIATDFATEGPPLNPIDSSSTSGIGGSVDLSAAISMATGGIDTSGSTVSGSISLESDAISLTGGTDSVLGSGASLLIQPASPGRDITIAGSSEGSMNLTVADLAALADGFGAITIGRADGAGTITVAGPDGTGFSDPLLLQSPGSGGSIVVNGPVQTNGNPLTLIAGDIADINADITTAGGAIAITSGGTIDTTGSFLRSSSTTQAGGNIILNAAGDITTGGQLISFGTTLGGDISLSSSNGNIDIADVLAAGASVPDNEGGILFTTDQGGSISIEAAGNVTAGEMFSVGELSDGDISIVSGGGTITVTGTLGDPLVSDGTGGAVALDAPGDIVAQDILATGLSGGGAITLASAEDIVTGSLTFGSPSGSGGGPLTANTPGVISIAGLTPNGADTVLGEVSAPSNILLPGTVNTGGGSLTLFVTDGYTFATDLTTDQGDFTLSGQQAVTLDGPIQTSSGDVTVGTGGALTLQAPIVTSDAQALILLVSESGVTNTLGESALQPGDGRYLVYSSDPAADTRGIPDDQFNKRYSFAFDPVDPDGADAGLPSEGNFFLYEITPTLTIVADDASRDFGEPNPAFSFTSSGLIDGDTLETALSEAPLLSTTAVVTSPPDDYPIDVGPSDLSSPIGYVIETTPGNLSVLPTEGFFKDANNIVLLPDVPIEERVEPAIPLVLTEFPPPVFTVPEVGSRRESSDLLSPNDGNRELWGPQR